MCSRRNSNQEALRETIVDEDGADKKMNHALGNDSGVVVGWWMGAEKQNDGRGEKKSYKEGMREFWGWEEEWNNRTIILQGLSPHVDLVNVIRNRRCPGRKCKVRFMVAGKGFRRDNPNCTGDTNNQLRYVF